MPFRLGRDMHRQIVYCLFVGL